MPHADLPRETAARDESISRDGAPRIAVIGAGVAGVSCAQALQQYGLHATLFEKSRGPGGRLATRRNEAGDHFDHGAQYITSRTPAFGQWLDALHGEGSAAAWKPRLVDGARANQHPWIVGTPSMNALLKPLWGGLDIRTQTSISALQRDGRRWRLLTEEGVLPDCFDVVITTTPCPQARALLAVDPTLQGALDGVTQAPCWALMISFGLPLAVDFDAGRFDTGATAWLARQASRPGHPIDNNAWVLHASAGWSADHLEREAGEAAALLQSDLARVIGQPLPEVSFAQAHRWRYALTTQALGQPFLANPDGTLFAAGDWCLGARVECAYESGVSVAQTVAKMLHPAR